ncbi:hypothetical protein [uncultured Treponema sp.]|uniref:hypothetical protein n=1 Tax=uncultured Treponema sp. TaxID=162155 RepID=UPI0015BF1DC8|nr:hypothetical protein [uncultured Treponema sp.]
MFSMFFVLFSSILTLKVFSQVVKTPFPVTSLSWNVNDDFFAFTEENTVFLRDCKTYSLSDTLPIKNIDRIMFSNEGKHQILLTITKEGFFSVYNLKETEGGLLRFDPEPYFTMDCTNENPVKCVTFGKNSDYAALALEDNSINMFFKLRFTKDAIFKKLEGHSEEIFSLNFSTNEKYLASTSVDNHAIIWSCNSQEKLLELTDIYTQSRIPVQFLSDSETIIAPENETTFCIYNIEGEKTISIDTLHKIKGIKPLNRQDTVAIVNENDEIELYDLSAKKWLGYIPSCDLSEMTDFEFNSDNTRILMGYESGSIFEFSVKDVLLSPGQKPPKKIMVSGRAYEEDGSGIGGGKSGGSRGWGITNGTFKTRDGNYAGATVKVRSAPAPYNLSTGLSFSFLNYDLLKPFYTGACATPYLGFPKENYPYKYTKNNRTLESPLLAGVELYAPFGIFIMPFVNYEIGISAELFAGTGLCFLWNRSFGAEAASSKPFASFTAGTKVSAFWKYFTASLCAQWDSVQKIMISADLGVSVKLEWKEKAQKQPKKAAPETAKTAPKTAPKAAPEEPQKQPPQTQTLEQTPQEQKNGGEQ